MVKALRLLLIIPLVFLAGCTEGDTPEGPKGAATSGFCPTTIMQYKPAPGQFVNEIPEYKAGMTVEDMVEAANSLINGGGLVSLGGWGGYIVYRLEKYIENRPGADFRIVGNAYYSSVIEGIQYGSCEPGIVYVMEDSNKNGLADEEWYELWGSVSNSAVEAIATYTRSTDDSYELKVAIKDEEAEYWIRNREYHDHPYFPGWISDEAITVSGRLLPANAIRLPNGQYTQECYTGYADAQPNNMSASALDISNARTLSGEPVNLQRIDFIKVQTGILQFNGPIGETSTEVGRIQVL